MRAKMVPKSIRSFPRAPLGLLWGALGLSFWYCFFNTIFERRNGSQNNAKWDVTIGGPSSQVLPPLPLSDSPPLTTTPKGDPKTFKVLRTLSGIYIYIYIYVYGISSYNFVLDY